MNRPQPPIDLASELRYPEGFAPAPDLERWLRTCFLEPGGPLYNADHEHLQQATLGVLWTNVLNTRQGNVVAATCEIPRPTQGGKWLKARLTCQLEEWFGAVPDFLLTFDAVIAAQAPDVPFCATVDHELYHAGQAVDAFGFPRFRKDDGRPVFATRGHDVEEHLGVIRRWGPQGVLNPKVLEMVRLAQEMPQVAAGQVQWACGTCGRLVV